MKLKQGAFAFWYVMVACAVGAVLIGMAGVLVELIIVIGIAVAAVIFMWSIYFSIEPALEYAGDLILDFMDWWDSR